MKRFACVLLFPVLPFFASASSTASHEVLDLSSNALVPVQIKEGRAYVGQLDVGDGNEVRANGLRLPSSPPSGVAMAQLGWPSGKVPYQFSGDFPEDQKARVLTSLRQFAVQAGIRFSVRKDEDDYLLLRPDPAICSSATGRQGGVQTVILSPRCMASPVFLLNVFGHALGLGDTSFHADRRYSPTGLQQFLSGNSVPKGLVSDLESVMAFSPGIDWVNLPRWTSWSQVFPERLSSTDIADLARLYPEQVKTVWPGETGVLAAPEGKSCLAVSHKRVRVMRGKVYATPSMEVCTGSDEQLWRRDDGGRLQNAAWPGQCLSIPKANLSLPRLTPCDGSSRQRWDLTSRTIESVEKSGMGLRYEAGKPATNRVVFDSLNGGKWKGFVPDFEWHSVVPDAVALQK